MRLLSHPTQPQGFEALDRAPEVIDSLLGEGVPLNKPALLDLLLAGNQQEALLRELLLGQCHRLHQAMPFLFEAIDDETVSAPRSAPVFRTIRSSHLTSSFLHRGFSYDYATT